MISEPSRFLKIWFIKLLEVVTQRLVILSHNEQRSRVGDTKSIDIITLIERYDRIYELFIQSWRVLVTSLNIGVCNQFHIDNIEDFSSGPFGTYDGFVLSSLVVLYSRFWLISNLKSLDRFFERYFGFDLVYMCNQ